MAIVRFPRRPGRPRALPLPQSDSGTPELVMKRLMGETAESLDLCLERGIISRRQHWCGIHLRWLYTLRYGAPGTRAIDPSHMGGVEICDDDPQWRALREKEYHDAMKKLADSGHALIVTNICIYNERPKFLNGWHPDARKKIRVETKILDDLCGGLDILVRHWDR